MDFHVDIIETIVLNSSQLSLNVTDEMKNWRILLLRSATFYSRIPIHYKLAVFLYISLMFIIISLHVHFIQVLVQTSKLQNFIRHSDIRHQSHWHIHKYHKSKHKFIFHTPKSQSHIAQIRHQHRSKTRSIRAYNY